MDRRRLLLVVAVGAGAALLLLGRPGGGQEPPVPTPAAEVAPTAGQPPAGQPPPGPGTPTGSPPPAVTPPPLAPHDESGVTGGTGLDPASADRAVAAAQQFAAIWAAPDPDWLAQLTPLATPALAEALAGADPPQPAREIIGPGRVLFEAPAWARIGVPADRGTVVLDVVAVGDEWLVAAIDWWPHE